MIAAKKMYVNFTHVKNEYADMFGEDGKVIDKLTNVINFEIERFLSSSDYTGGTVESYRDEVDELKSENNLLKDDIDELEADLDAAKEEISDFEAENIKLRETIIKLEKAVSDNESESELLHEEIKELRESLEEMHQHAAEKDFND